MNIVIVHAGVIPAVKYGGTERVIWYLGRELVKKGHQVTYLVNEGSSCHFAKVIFLKNEIPLSAQIPENTEVVHLNSIPEEPVGKPYLVTIHGNYPYKKKLDINSVFVSENHASRYGSSSFVHNGLDWDDYGKPSFSEKKEHFHFLGDASWRVKNVRGAIEIVRSIPGEILEVLGGTRLNFRMGFRLTLNSRIHFRGMIDTPEKIGWMQHSRGLIFPVRWHEPFGLAIIESLYFGCPVFGTPYGSLPEIVIPEVGFLSNQKAVLREMMKNASEFSGKHCHDYVVEHFNAGKMAESYLKKYEMVLNGNALNRSLPELQTFQRRKFLEWR